MKRIFICSPYSGDVETNIEIAKTMCLMAIADGHNPFAPHLMYPGFLDDTDPEQRAAGIQCGCSFLEVCDEMWAYVGNGISGGMAYEMGHAKQVEIPIEEMSGSMDFLRWNIQEIKNKTLIFHKRG